MESESEVFRVEPLKRGVIFQKGFKQPEIFTNLVESFTGVRIKIDEVENEKAFVNPVGKVDIRFDLFAEDKKNRIIVEAQHGTNKSLDYYFDRFFYYHAAAMLEMIRSSSNYRFPKLVLTLVFFTKIGPPKMDHNVFIQDLEIRTARTGEIVNFPQRLKHKVFFIFTSDPRNDLDMPVAQSEWVEAINDTINGTIFVNSDYLANPYIQKMLDSIRVEKTTTKERAKMQAEATQEALDDAKQEGRKEGRKEEREETIQKLRAEFSDEKIARLLMIPLEEFQRM